MSWGRPGGFSSFKPTPPERGSFPLDHDGECKTFMKEYLTCLSVNKGVETPCRAFSKAYLNCRMQTGLMAKDDWENLGLHDVAASDQSDVKKSPPVEQGSEKKP